MPLLSIMSMPCTIEHVKMPEASASLVFFRMFDVALTHGNLLHFFFLNVSLFLRIHDTNGCSALTSACYLHLPEEALRSAHIPTREVLESTLKTFFPISKSIYDVSSMKFITSLQSNSSSCPQSGTKIHKGAT